MNEITLRKLNRWHYSIKVKGKLKYRIKRRNGSYLVKTVSTKEEYHTITFNESLDYILRKEGIEE